MDRKDFLLKGCALCTVASIVTYLDSCSGSNGPNNSFNFTVDLSNAANSALLHVGRYIIQNSAIVIRTSTVYKALSLICTHQGCTVNYSASMQEFICPCHGGTYDANGNVLAGPPPSALQTLNVSQNGNVLTVHS